MTKRYAAFLTLLFVGFLGLFLCAHLLTPDKSFSELENRYLQQLPAPTPETLLTGKFMEDFDGYTTDQFAGRDGWIAAKARCERLSGKQENNGIYFCADDTLITRFDQPDVALTAKNLGYVSALTDNLDVPVYFSLIPGAAAVWADRLPDDAPNADQTALLETAKRGTSAIWADIGTALTAHSGQELFYRTDHHWTSLGAYYGYTALMDAMGLPVTPLSDYDKTTVSSSFYGTAYSASGAYWTAPDRIDTYVPDEGLTVTSWATGVPTTTGLYDESYLSLKDKYSYFLGGNQPLCVIQTAQTDPPRLLIVRDSYSDSLVPFLTADFSEIHLYDLRYNRQSVSDYVAENDIDMVLVLYSVANFVSDSNLFLLAQ